MKTSDLKALVKFHMEHAKHTEDFCITCGTERKESEHNFGTDEYFVCSLCYHSENGDFEKLDNLLNNFDE